MSKRIQRLRLANVREVLEHNDGAMFRNWRVWIVLFLGVLVIACRTDKSSMAQSLPTTEPPHATPLSSRILRVGPNKQYTKPSQAAAVARDGDVIELDPVVYARDAAIWRAHNLTIRGVGGRAHLIANGADAEGKGIWVIQGNNTTIENIEFSGAEVPDTNGAGIRQEGTGLTVRHCYFHHNQMGILTGVNLKSDILVEHSEFAWNGDRSGQTHNIYIGQVRSFTLRYSYSRHAHIGHLVKSRAHTNYILYNRLADEANGDSSYNIDLPNGGVSYIVGNIIQQSPATDNSAIVAYALEGPTNPSQELYVINNTFVNDRHTGVFIQVKGTPAVVNVVNNVFVGKGTVLTGTSTPPHNLVTNGSGFVDRTNFNYHLTADSPAIDAGIAPGSANGIDLTPVWQHMYPTGKGERRVVGKALDMGAYEFGITSPAAESFSPPSNLVATAVSPSQVKLSWQASPDNGRAVKGYKVYRNGAEITTTTTAAYTDTGLTPYTTYTYTTVAYDDKGKTSDQSSSVQVATPRVLNKGLPSDPGWYELPNTKLRPVCATEPSIQGWTGCSAVIGAWNSGVFDTKRNRLILWGGGHTEYYGNEIYTLNLEKFTIERLTEPGLPAADLKNCVEAIAHDTQPNTRHTYDGIAYIANVDRMFVFSGFLACGVGHASTGTWTFDFVTKKWQRMNPKGPIPAIGPGIMTAYDPDTGKIFLHDKIHLFTYDFHTDSYERLSSQPIGADYHLTGVIDPKRRKFVMIGGRQSWIYDIASKSSYTPQVLATTGGDVIVQAPYPGLAYYPSTGRIVAWHGGDTVYSLDLETKVWTPHIYHGGPGSPSPNGTYKRWSYSPDTRCLYRAE